MSLPSLAPRRIIAVTVAAVAGLAGLQHLPAVAAPVVSASPTLTTGASRLPTPTSAARAAGVEPGNAPMGWRSALTRPALTAKVTGPALAAKAFVPSGVLGMDVSSYQGTVKWPSHAKAHKQFAYIKATEGTGYKNPYFASQYKGAYKAGLIRGAYHFASPSGSSGKKQADYFVKHGGAWTADGHTLPGVLDIEYNPYGKTCYGVSKKKMISWVNSFVVEYKRLTTRDAVIYTTTDWWTRCTGNTKKFSLTNPLWAARYGTKDAGKLPGSWPWATFWQYTSTPFDQNRFSSKRARLLVLAKNAA
ncbi:lysozyme [uncultured Friedmanniella sp.]|uniref:lysozyme n=1 Tax=uncultured Friedmanniella sp. TaxID=335381 RepID=UPI0035CA0FB9